MLLTFVSLSTTPHSERGVYLSLGAHPTETIAHLLYAIAMEHLPFMRPSSITKCGRFVSMGIGRRGFFNAEVLYTLMRKVTCLFVVSPVFWFLSCPDKRTNNSCFKVPSKRSAKGDDSFLFPVLLVFDLVFRQAQNSSLIFLKCFWTLGSFAWGQKVFPVRSK